MTTPEAAARYEQQHVAEHSGKRCAIFNPNGLPEAELPVIYGFNNGGQPGWYDAVLLAQDGVCLGSHLCSSEAYMLYDLGILEGTRPDRHEDFRKHYPGGYRMEFVSGDPRSHAGLVRAFEQNQKSASTEKPV